MPVRLRNSMKDKIVGRALAYAFDARKAQLREDKLTFGNDCYHDLYPPALLLQMGALPEGYLRADTATGFRFEGVETYANVFWGERRRLANCHYGCCAKVYDHAHPLTLRWKELKERGENLETERDQARLSIRSVLNSVTTMKRLVGVWPEVQPFIEDLQEQQRQSLPALPINDLNARLGLPVAEGV